MNESFERMIPLRSAFSWDDFYRFATNNNIGRKIYQPFINDHHDAGRALGALADSMGGEYFPANYWKICYNYGLTQEQYFSAVDAIAQDLTNQRNSESEPYKYWEFVVNNCYLVMDAAFKDGGLK